MDQMLWDGNKASQPARLYSLTDKLEPDFTSPQENVSEDT